MKMKVDDEKTGSILRHGPALLVLFVAVLFVHDIFGAHGYLSMRHTQDGIKKVKAEIEHLARPGEIIIKIPQSQLLPQAFNTRP
jgi:cell division protein FtsB